MTKVSKTPLSELEWREKLSSEQYAICREGGTERPFSGQYYHHDAVGLYRCVCCGSPLFSSTEKYNSGSGWPSFYAPYHSQNLQQTTDNSHGMQRIEITCKSCDAHLGHVFNDGPAPTGLRYCVNSASLDFEPEGL